MYIYIYTNIFLRYSFYIILPIIVFFLCQETCVYAKITALRCLKIDSEHVQK